MTFGSTPWTRRIFSGFGAIVVTMSIVACGTQQVASPASSPLSEASNQTPTIGAQNPLSLVSCDDDSMPVVLDRPQMDGHVFILEACGGATKSLLIEDFILDGTDRSSDGLMSGPDDNAVFAGPCMPTVTEIMCPVNVVAENGDSNASTLTISKMDEGYVWSLAN